MKTQVNIGLEGAFKVDFYSGGKFVETTDWFNNFITPTGLFYPNIYPFVDCFRFLSLGSDGSTPNSGGYVTGVGFTGASIGTTGLSSPINSYTTLQGTTESGTYIGWQGYANGTDSNSQSACGTVLTEKGIRFYRAWTIPTGGVDYYMGTGGLTINEFMVSPSSGNDATGRWAFSRVRRTVTIPVGYSAIISYQLSINLQNTGLTYFGPNTFSTGLADVTSDEDDFGLVSGWNNLSGYYRHVYHGLNIINSAGAHDTPEYGCGMEPSISNLSDYCFYLSPDNSHFDVTKTGNPNSDVNKAYQADGLMGSIFGIQTTYPVSRTSFSDVDFYGPTPTAKGGISDYPDSVNTPFNIRIGKDGFFNLPPISNYASGKDFGSFNYQDFHDASQQPISYATPGYLQKNPNKVDYTQKAIFSTRIFKQPIDLSIPQNTISGRSKTITRKTLFSPVSSLGYNTRFGSLVFASNLAPNTNSQSIYYPMVDTLFFDTSGRSLMQHYRFINVILDNRGTGVADSYFNILPNGENINVFANAKTFQGEYDIADSNPYGFNPNHPAIIGNKGILLSGYSDINNVSGDATFSSSGCSGYGMVYGILTGEKAGESIRNGYLDCGLVDHNVTGNSTRLSLTLAPTSTGIIYWPNKSSQLKLSITGIKYYSTQTVPFDFAVSGSIPLTSGELIDAGYNWTTNPYSFCPPTGHIVHFENIGETGYRLLPNHGIPNNSGNNYYPALTGGVYPGLSFNNGIELYFNISWSSPCSDSINCL